jgi:hypothetical protein
MAEEERARPSRRRSTDQPGDARGYVCLLVASFAVCVTAMGGVRFCVVEERETSTEGVISLHRLSRVVPPVPHSSSFPSPPFAGGHGQQRLRRVCSGALVALIATSACRAPEPEGTAHAGKQGSDRSTASQPTIFSVISMFLPPLRVESRDGEGKGGLTEFTPLATSA